MWVTVTVMPPRSFVIHALILLQQYLVTRRVTYWLKRGCFMTFWEFFPRKVKNIIFAWRGACEMRSNPHEMRLNIKMNIPVRGEHGLDGELGSGGQSSSRGPYLVSHLLFLVAHPINESPKWNSLLLDIFLSIVQKRANNYAYAVDQPDR